MRIVTAGGGSGGHVTPVLAVIKALKSKTAERNMEVHFVCDRIFADQANKILSSDPEVKIQMHKIYAGKLRRYHGVSLAKQLLDIPTTLKNLKDVFFIGIGCIQSYFLLMRTKPDVVFTKGGFVCLPLGLAAVFLRIPLVIHDSDAHPGLTNRVLAKWATYIGTGAPLENYKYDSHKSFYVGIPIAEAFKPFSEEEKRKAKRALKLPDLNKPLVVVTGGGLGARRLNDGVLMSANKILQFASVLHISGAALYKEVSKKAPSRADYIVLPFVHKNMDRILGAADVVVARAGATNMAELAATHSPTVLVPNDMLTGGHQTKNASVYKSAKAAIVISEAELKNKPEILFNAIEKLLKNDNIKNQLSTSISQFARLNSAADMAELIIRAVKKA